MRKSKAQRAVNNAAEEIRNPRRVPPGEERAEAERLSKNMQKAARRLTTASQRKMAESNTINATNNAARRMGLR